MINIAILGFGVVGSGVAEVITQNQETIKKKIGDSINIKYILDLREFPDSPFADKIVHDYNVILNDEEISIVAEAMGGKSQLNQQPFNINLSKNQSICQFIEPERLPYSLPAISAKHRP